MAWGGRPIVIPSVVEESIKNCLPSAIALRISTAARDPTSAWLELKVKGPRRPPGTIQQAIGLRVVGEALRDRIPLQRSF